MVPSPSKSDNVRLVTVNKYNTRNDFVRNIIPDNWQIDRKKKLILCKHGGFFSSLKGNVPNESANGVKKKNQKKTR